MQFFDIDNSFAKDAIAQAAKAGIMNGDATGSFKPDESSTRAEALTVVLNA
nr:S-layer homology domain-containing protein [Paenibacillus sp. SYP-B3998]